MVSEADHRSRIRENYMEKKKRRLEELKALGFSGVIGNN